MAGISIMVVGALSRILQGAFGLATPNNFASSPAAVQSIARYRNPGQGYNPGDIIGTGGAQSWVYQPPFETALQTMWGGAFLRKPNTFSPISLPQVLSWPTITVQGLGGVVPGQYVTQPLSLPSENEG